MDCVNKTEIPYNDCLKPCQGLYVDVKKQPVEIVQVPQYQIMMKAYENYTWFQNNIDSQRQSLKGTLHLYIIQYFSDSWLCANTNLTCTNRYTT